MSEQAFEINHIDDEQGVRGCYGLMRQLRPHLGSADEFVARWRCQQQEGYRLLALRAQGRTVALAGYRVQHNLVHDRFLYVDDLVTEASLRGAGHGAAMLARLKLEAERLDCGKLVLDTPLSNALGQRFYFRQGMLSSAMRFNLPITRRAAPATI